MYNSVSSGLVRNALPQPLQSPQASSAPTLLPSDPFWQRSKLQAHFASLLENLAILKCIGDELEAVQPLDRPVSGLGHRQSDGPEKEIPGAEENSNDCLSWEQESACSLPAKEILLKTERENVNYWPESTSLATQAAQQLLGVVRGQLEPLQRVLDGSVGQGKALAANKLVLRRQKLARNRKWRSRKRRRVAEALQKEREQYEGADCEADEWRAQNIAKLIAKRKMEKMKELAEKTSKEDKARLQEEMEMVLIIEKLQELRALRIIKLKRQGKFFPEEDDQFLEQVRAAVEEEERQAAAARNTSAATTAILNAEEARKAAADRASDHIELQERELKGLLIAKDAEECDEDTVTQDFPDAELKNSPAKITEGKVQAQSVQMDSDWLKGSEGLSPEFYQYYFGSNFDMASLIEVRQAWDAFVMLGGSRIPQHWIEAPPPADPVWASYLVKEQVKKKRKKMQ